MAGATNLVEETLLNAMFRHIPTTTVSGSNASTTNILVTSSTGFLPGHFVLMTTAGTYHQVTAVPDATHVTITPAMAAAPTTGSMTAWAWAPYLTYIALYTANPTDAGGGTEVSTGDYARKQVTIASGSWNAPAGTPRLIDNVAAIEWLAITWSGTVTGWGIKDASTAGNLLWWFDSTDIAPASGDNVRFIAGGLDITVD